MNEQFVNLPGGLKRSLEQFRAIATGEGQAVGGFGDSVSVGAGVAGAGAAGGGGSIQIGPFEEGAFQVASLEDFLQLITDLIEQAAQNQLGNPGATGGGR